MTNEEWNEILKDLRKVVEANPDRTVFFVGRIHGAWQKLPVKEITEDTVWFSTGEHMTHKDGAEYNAKHLVREGFVWEVPILV